MHIPKVEPTTHSYMPDRRRSEKQLAKPHGTQGMECRPNGHARKSPGTRYFGHKPSQIDTTNTPKKTIPPNTEAPSPAVKTPPVITAFNKNIGSQ